VKDYEDFHELVFKPVIAVGACNWADCNRALDRLEGNSKRKLTQLERDKLIQFSGGHVGLLKTLFVAVEQSNLNLAAPNSQAQLQKRADVASECSKIWDSLEKEEKTALQALAQGQPMKDNVLFRLASKDIVRGDTPRILIPLFEGWVAQRLLKPQPNAQAQVQLDPISKNFLIDGRLIHDVDEVTFELFKVLIDKRNQPVLPVELLDVMRKYPARGNASGPPDQRLERLMGELLDRVNTPARQYVVSEADGSYRFKD
jgi:hypothetical protein